MLLKPPEWSCVPSMWSTAQPLSPDSSPSCPGPDSGGFSRKLPLAPSPGTGPAFSLCAQILGHCVDTYALVTQRVMGTQWEERGYILITHGSGTLCPGWPMWPASS